MRQKQAIRIAANAEAKAAIVKAYKAGGVKAARERAASLYGVGYVKILVDTIREHNAAEAEKMK